MNRRAGAFTLVAGEFSGGSTDRQYRCAFHHIYGFFSSAVWACESPTKSSAKPAADRVLPGDVTVCFSFPSRLHETLLVSFEEERGCTTIMVIDAAVAKACDDYRRCLDCRIGFMDVGDDGILFLDGAHIFRSAVNVESVRFKLWWECAGETLSIWYTV